MNKFVDFHSHREASVSSPSKADKSIPEEVERKALFPCACCTKRENRVVTRILTAMEIRDADFATRRSRELSI